MRYARLTKVVSQGGKECVACINYGTDMCRIHTNTDFPDCYHCKMFAAILNQLNYLEDIVVDEFKNKEE